MTNCEAYWDLISASLDGALTPDEAARLEEHLAQCPACRAMREELRGLEADLGELERPAGDFTDRVMARAAQTEQDIPFTDLPRNRKVGREAQKQVNAWWKPIRTVGALAACCLLVLGLGALLTHSGLFSAGSSSSAAAQDEACVEESAAYGSTAAETAGEESAATASEVPMEPVSGRPAIYMDGRAYVNPYMPVSELPEGFSLAGTLTEEQAGDIGVAGCEYYTNPDCPDEFYVYQQCGTPVGPDTVDTTQLQWAYIRWVALD